MTSSAAASEVIAFIKQQTVYSFGMLGLITPDVGLFFPSSLLEEFLIICGIRWKTVRAYVFMSNGRTERMTSSVKGETGEMGHRKP